MRGGNALQKMSVAVRDHRHYGLENENVDKNVVVRTARCCNADLTLTWFEAALLDVSGSPDLPDISMNVTECHCGFLHLQCQHCGASVSEAWCC